MKRNLYYIVLVATFRYLSGKKRQASGWYASEEEGCKGTVVGSLLY